jgi:hypothetical protein
MCVWLGERFWGSEGVLVRGGEVEDDGPIGKKEPMGQAKADMSYTSVRIFPDAL